MAIKQDGQLVVILMTMILVMRIQKVERIVKIDAYLHVDVHFFHGHKEFVIKNRVWSVSEMLILEHFMFVV